MKVVLFALAFGFAAANDVTAQDVFHVGIHRKHQSADCTSGYLSVDKKIIAYALELPWKGNQPVISSIPAGTYQANLRYDHADQWRIELRDVPGRGNIQIHVGNYTSDIQGCILVGESLAANLCSVLNSKTAYTSLKNAFYGAADPVMTPNKAIRVTVEE